MKDSWPVIVLAGGLGTRLQPVVSNCPKVMAPVLDRPFLEWQLCQLARNGFRRFVLAVGYLAQQIKDYFGNGSRWGWEITYADEPTLLGTAGAIRNAALAKDTRLEPDEPFLVMNGDTYLEVDLAPLIKTHLKQACVGTIGLVYMENASRYGAVHLLDSGRIERFREKSSEPAFGLINAGIYVFDSQIVQLIPDGRPVSIEREIFPQLLATGQALYGVILQGAFVDMGTPESYAQITLLLRSRQSTKPAGYRASITS